MNSERSGVPADDKSKYSCSLFMCKEMRTATACHLFFFLHSAVWADVSVEVESEVLIEVDVRLRKEDASPLPASCDELLDAGERRSGVFRLRTASGVHSAVCDQQTAGGGWTVVQRRVDGRTAFWNRTWADYRAGFGRVGENSSFWAGNALLHDLTADPTANWTLRVELDGDRNPQAAAPTGFWFGEYTIRVDDEAANFTLHIAGRKAGGGNATKGWYVPSHYSSSFFCCYFGFDITASDGRPFSTLDRVHDADPNCQRDFRIGGWWSWNCGMAALNGEYTPRRWADGFGLFFVLNGRQVVNPRRTRMLVRRQRAVDEQKE
ncbi:Fibrinogen C-terminal domain-containing protein [Aphelenchoides fujianensis]|nr:Fibrinogen C-terminal domain-containing protein [Aphelenchoides fujianensis]